MKGRKPVSDHLKVIRGTNQPCRMRGDMIVEHINKLPEPPREMSRTARRLYKDCGHFILMAKVLTPVDIWLLEMFAIEIGRYRDLSYQLEKIDLTADMDEFQERKYKRMKSAAREAFENGMKIAIELGLTPAARLKFAIKREEPDELQTLMQSFK